VRHRQVLDVARRVVDLLDLQRVDDQAELGHLRAGRLTRTRRELLAVADHVLDGHRADDGSQVTGEDVVHALVHQVLLVEETTGGVGDAARVVADLEDRRAADVDGNALMGDAIDLKVGLVQVERQPTHCLVPRHHQRALAGDDAKAHFVAGAVLGDALVAEARDDQGFAC
jgi:hypothetical protein